MALVKPQVAPQEDKLSAEAVVQTAEQTVEVAAEVQAAAQVESGEQLTQEGVEATAAPAAEAEVVELATAAEPAPTAVAAVAEPAAKAVSVTEQRTNAMAQFTQQQAEMGFEGLELSGMSFDRIKLHEGQFKLGSDETELGTEFSCVVHSTRKIFVVRQSDDNDAESFYSYDPQGKTFTDGNSAQEKLEDWLDDGYGTEENPLDIREYLEAMATLVNRDDEHDGTMVMLSIPPASKARLAGVAAQAYTRFKGATLSDVVTQCSVGKKIGEGQKAFRPWVFKATGRYEG